MSNTPELTAEQVQFKLRSHQLYGDDAECVFDLSDAQSAALIRQYAEQECAERVAKAQAKWAFAEAQLVSKLRAENEALQTVLSRLWQKMRRMCNQEGRDDITHDSMLEEIGQVSLARYEALQKAKAELAKLKGEREKLEVLAYHTGEGPRQWYTVSSWLRKGQTIVLMDALPPPPAKQEDSHETETKD